MHMCMRRGLGNHRGACEVPVGLPCIPASILQAARRLMIRRWGRRWCWGRWWECRAGRVGGGKERWRCPRHRVIAPFRTRRCGRGSPSVQPLFSQRASSLVRRYNMSSVSGLGCKCMHDVNAAAPPAPPDLVPLPAPALALAPDADVAMPPYGGARPLHRW